MTPVCIEGRRVSALKAEDRLLFIADGEDGPRGVEEITGSLPGEEFFRELLHDLPLLGAGVLRLVDQDVIEATVQFVQDPGGCFRLV